MDRSATGTRYTSGHCLRRDAFSLYNKRFGTNSEMPHSNAMPNHYRQALSVIKMPVAKRAKRLRMGLVGPETPSTM
jgi:hypothetical protein